MYICVLLMSKLKRKTGSPDEWKEPKKITKNDQIYRENILHKNHRYFEGNTNIENIQIYFIN